MNMEDIANAVEEKTLSENEAFCICLYQLQ
jgi:hypothetical protein